MTDRPRKVPSRPAGLRDVAQRAGIAIATASAVLNGSSSNTRFSQATRERVQAVAKEMGYYPNALARGLIGRPTKTLGVLFGLEGVSLAVSNPYAFTVFQGVTAGATDAGYDITLFTQPWLNEEHSAGVLRGGRTDGIILIATTAHSDVVASLEKTGMPAVVISSGSNFNIPSVDVDNAEGVRLAIEHLLALGHRRIAHLSGDWDLISSVERQDAFFAALSKAGLPVHAEYAPLVSNAAASGYDLARRLLALPSPPTAIFADNDVMALDAITAARDCGVDVPGRLSVIGFDDISMLALEAAGLTTVRQPLTQIGRTGSHMLIKLIENEQVYPANRLFTPELIVRRSTAPPR